MPVLARNSQRPSTGGDHGQAGQSRHELSDDCVGVGHLFEVVQDHQCATVRQVLGDPVRGPLSWWRVDHLADGRPHQVGAGDRGQRHEVDPVRKVDRQLSGQLDRQAGLARTSWSRERHQPDLGLSQQVGQGCDLLVTTDQPGGCRREAGFRADRPQRAELGLQPVDVQLPQAFRRRDVLQLVQAEVAQAEPGGQGVARELGGHRGHDDLASVRGRRDAGGAMHVHTDVTAVVHLRRTGVHTDPHLHVLTGRPRVRVELSLHLGRRGDRVAGGAERHEEAVALGSHLGPVVGRPSPTHDPPVAVQGVGVCGPETVQQQRGTLDVGEQHRYRPGWQLHDLAPSRPLANMIGETVQATQSPDARRIWWCGMRGSDAEDGAAPRDCHIVACRPRVTPTPVMSSSPGGSDNGALSVTAAGRVAGTGVDASLADDLVTPPVGSAGWRCGSRP
jgi:hypothetical protein